jgi:hypothetical protein
MNIGPVGSIAAANVTQRAPDITSNVPALQQPTADATRAEPAAVSAAPFLNPAMANIATMAIVNPNSVAPPPPAPTDPVLYGDSGFLIQAYGAVALLYGPQNLEPVFGLPPPPPIPAIEPI